MEGEDPCLGHFCHVGERAEGPVPLPLERRTPPPGLLQSQSMTEVRGSAPAADVRVMWLPFRRSTLRPSRHVGEARAGPTERPHAVRRKSLPTGHLRRVPGLGEKPSQTPKPSTTHRRHLWGHPHWTGRTTVPTTSVQCRCLQLRSLR